MGSWNELSTNSSHETPDHHDQHDTTDHHDQHEQSSALHQAALFGEGAVSGAILNPINAMEQIYNHAANTNLPPLEFSNQAEVKNSFAGNFGITLGMGADAVAAYGAAGLFGLKGLSVAKAGLSGAMFSGLMLPSEHGDKMSGGALLADRLTNAAIGGGTMMVLTGFAPYEAEATLVPKKI